MDNNSLSPSNSYDRRNFASMHIIVPDMLERLSATR